VGVDEGVVNLNRLLRGGSVLENSSATDESTVSPAHHQPLKGESTAWDSLGLDPGTFYAVAPAGCVVAIPIP